MARKKSRTPSEIEAQNLLSEPYDASDEETIAHATKESAKRERARLEFLEGVMSSPEGRSWIWNLMAVCGMHDNPVVPGDPYVTHENIGKQNTGKAIFADVIQFPELYFLMAREAREGNLK